MGKCVQMVIERRRTTACLISEIQTATAPTAIWWSQILEIFVLCYICLLFNLKVKSVSAAINICAFLCIECRTNDLFCNYFQKAENVCVTVRVAWDCHRNSF